MNPSSTEEIAVLERDQVLELIHRLLLENRAAEATELSRLLLPVPEVLPGVSSDPLELDLHDLVERREYGFAASRFDSRSENEIMTVEAERLAGVAIGWVGRYEDARRHLLRARARGSGRAILNLAALEFRSQKFSASIRLLEQAVETGGFNEDELIEFEDQLGDAYQALGDFERAQRHYAKALERLEALPKDDPRLAWILRRLSAFEFSLARYSQALNYAERGLHLSRDAITTVPLAAYRALSLALLGRDDEARTAIEPFQNIVNSDPSAQVRRFLSLGVLEWLNANRNGALEHYKDAARLANAHGLRREAFLIGWQLMALHQQCGDLEAMRCCRAELRGLFEPSIPGNRFERTVVLADAFVQLHEVQFDAALDKLEPLAHEFSVHHQPAETMIARLLAAEAHLALGQIERGRRTLLLVLDWWELHDHTPLVSLVMGSIPRVVGFTRASGDTKLELLYSHFASRYGPPLETIYLVTLTAYPELRFGDRPVPLGNRHVVPLLTYLHSKGNSGATVADVGRDLFPDLRGEPLRNRVKNARNELRDAITATVNSDPNGFVGLEQMTVTSIGNTRSMVLHLETGRHFVRWDLQELEQALGIDTSDWVWLLTTYHDEFLDGYDLENDEAWIQNTRDRLRSKLLERASSLVADWFVQGRLEQLRSLVKTLLERGIFDPASPLADVIAAYEVRAVGTLIGKEAALAVWLAHESRFRAAFVDAPELESVYPNRKSKP
jgi:tetratricopeptide (TPR) repeat protein